GWMRMRCFNRSGALAKSGETEETNMSERRYPNESKEYRDARASLLKDEQELVDKAKAVAEKRRKLPPGGQLKEDYVFQWANDGRARRTWNSPSCSVERTSYCFTRS